MLFNFLCILLMLASNFLCIFLRHAIVLLFEGAQTYFFASYILKPNLLYVFASCVRSLNLIFCESKFLLRTFQVQHVSCGLWFCIRVLCLYQVLFPFLYAQLTRSCMFTIFIHNTSACVFVHCIEFSALFIFSFIDFIRDFL